jgi:D-alanyl-D-alanine carboxypeptidase
MSYEKNNERVQRQYAASSRGDVSTIPEHTTDDAHWGAKTCEVGERSEPVSSQPSFNDRNASDYRNVPRRERSVDSHPVLRIAFVAWAVASTFLAGACGESSDPAAATFSNSEIAELQARADKVVAAGVPGIVLLVRQGEQTIHVISGESSLASASAPASAMRTSDRFRIGSITKTFVTSVVLQLIDEGKVHFTDTVETWLPGAVPASAKATIEQLLRHQSGVFDYFDDPRVLAPYLAGEFSYAWTHEQLVAIAADHEPLFVPGAQYSYSNTNYTLLGLVLEKATGATLEDLIRDRIVRPLALDSTSAEVLPAIDEPFAHGYLISADGPPLDVTAVSPSHAWAAGSIVSTAHDVAIFYRALLAGKVVRASQLDAMLTPDPAMAPSEYAMGIVRTSFFPCDVFFGHDGAVAGYNSVAYVRKDGGRQFVLLANAFTLESAVGDDTAKQAFFDLAMAAACGSAAAPSI